jgi:hypothetical protein
VLRAAAGFVATGFVATGFVGVGFVPAELVEAGAQAASPTVAANTINPEIIQRIKASKVDLENLVQCSGFAVLMGEMRADHQPCE